MSDIKQVSVDILDKEYNVSSPEEEVHQLKQAAKELDSRMREIKASGKISGSERIAST
jgi:cell division protein ZapA